MLDRSLQKPVSLFLLLCLDFTDYCDHFFSPFLLQYFPLAFCLLFVRYSLFRLSVENLVSIYTPFLPSRAVAQRWPQPPSTPTPEHITLKLHSAKGVAWTLGVVAALKQKGWLNKGDRIDRDGEEKRLYKNGKKKSHTCFVKINGTNISKNYIPSKHECFILLA
jgi:hypothetical protein